jgi:hypothetical protein
MAVAWDKTGEEGFCESLLWTPEYLNVISSAAMFVFGLLGSICSDSPVVLRLVFDLIAVNGVFSALYHGFLYEFFGFMDISTMTVAAYLGAYGLLDILWKKTWPGKRFVYRCLSCFSGLVCTTFMLLTLSLDSISFGVDISYQYLFMAPLGVIVIAVPWERAWIYSRRQFSLKVKDETRRRMANSQVDQAFRAFYMGIGVLVAVGVMWLLTEPYCHDNNTNTKWIRYGPFHALWHIGAAWGFYLVLISQSFLLQYSFSLREPSPYFVDSSYFFWRVLVPSVRVGVVENGTARHQRRQRNQARDYQYRTKAGSRLEEGFYPGALVSPAN